MENDVSRIKKLLNYTKKSKNSLGVSIGDRNGMRLQHIEKGRNTISEKLASDITRVYPEINYSWLLTGEGEMLKSKVLNNNLEPEDNFEEIQGLTDVALYDVQLSEEKLKNANKRIELLEELVESYKLEINDLKNELLRFTKGNINSR